MSQVKNRPEWLNIAALAIGLEMAALSLTSLFGDYWGFNIPQKVELGQLIVELILIPLGVVAFWQAGDALRYAAARPKLRFAFLGEDGLLHDTYQVTLPPGGGSANRITLAVENQGDAIAVWWQANFDIPVDLMKKLRVREGSVQVNERHVPVTMDTVGDVEKYSAQSTGNVALFPGQPVQVGAVHIDYDPKSKVELEGEYFIHYQLLTDRTEPIEGRIPLKFKKGD